MSLFTNFSEGTVRAAISKHLLEKHVPVESFHNTVWNEILNRKAPTSIDDVGKLIDKLFIDFGDYDINLLPVLTKIRGFLSEFMTPEDIEKSIAGWLDGNEESKTSTSRLGGKTSTKRDFRIVLKEEPLDAIPLQWLLRLGIIFGVFYIFTYIL